MRHTGILACAAIIGAGLQLAPSLAQQKGDGWADSECKQSRIAVEAEGGLRCQVIEMTGSDQGGSGGSFRVFSAFSSADQGKSTFYVLTEAVMGGYVYADPLSSDLRKLPAAKDATGHSESLTYNGVSYMRFTAHTGEACIGARKVGPGHSAGYRWIMMGTKCVVGRRVPQADEEVFMDSMKVR